MPPDTTVRLALPADAAALELLRRRAIASGVPAAPPDPAPPSFRTYVLCAGSELAGFCDVDCTPSLDWAPAQAVRILAFYVPPERAHSGYGAHLALAVLRLEPNVGAWVGTAPADNVAIRGFWAFLEHLLAHEGWRLSAHLGEDGQARFVALQA
jgi:hypothetical protein